MSLDQQFYCIKSLWGVFLALHIEPYERLEGILAKFCDIKISDFKVTIVLFTLCRFSEIFATKVLQSPVKISAISPFLCLSVCMSLSPFLLSLFLSLSLALWELDLVVWRVMNLNLQFHAAFTGINTQYYQKPGPPNYATTSSLQGSRDSISLFIIRLYVFRSNHSHL